MKVFLGGTANNSNWRNYIIENIKMDYFDPIVENWDEEAKQQEILERELCDWVLYVISPKMIGVYSIAEAVYDACKRPGKTLFCVLETDEEYEFTSHQISSLKSTEKLIESCGARVFNNLDEIINFLNFVYEKHI